MEVVPGVHRLGSSLVNWYVVVDGDRLTLIDAGLPGYWRQLEPALRGLGASMSDVDAIVLTHSHVDHTGFAERVRATGGATVHVHRDDDEKGARKFPPLHLYWRPSSWPLLVEGMRNGLLVTPAVKERTTFDGDGVLPVPGKPRVVHMPGHTAGNCALVLDDPRVVFTGDGLVTLDPYTQARGPRLLIDGVNEDPREARSSLERLRGLGEHILLPGHGEPWQGDLDAAVDEALR